MFNPSAPSLPHKRVAPGASQVQAPKRSKTTTGPAGVVSSSGGSVQEAEAVKGLSSGMESDDANDDENDDEDDEDEDDEDEDMMEEAQEMLDKHNGDVQAAMDQLTEEATLMASRVLPTSAMDNILSNIDSWRRCLDKAAARTKRKSNDDASSSSDNNDDDSEGDEDDADEAGNKAEGDEEDDAANSETDDDDDADDEADEGLVEVCLDMLMQHGGDREAALIAMVRTNPLALPTHRENRAHEKALDEACIRYGVMENAARQAEARAECALQNAADESKHTDDKSNTFQLFCKTLATKIATSRDSNGQLTKSVVCYNDM